MSVPARNLAGVAAPRRVGASPGRPRSVPRPTPPRTHGVPAAGATSAVGRRRLVARRFHPAFWAMTAAILTTLVVALVSVSALAVETGFGIDRTEARIAELLDEGERLRSDVATMSAPGRIAHWAARKGLVIPENVIVLQVPGDAADADAAPAGGEDDG